MFLAATNLYRRFSNLRSHKIAEKILPFLPKSGSVLDFGCGNGFTSKVILDQRSGLHITGLDVIRDQNLQIDDNSNFSFSQYEGGSIPFEAGEFDAVIASSSLHHTSDPYYYLREMVRVTKFGGSIILVEEMYINFLDRIWISGQDYFLNKMKKGVPVPLEFRSNKHYLEEFARQNLEILNASSVRPSFPYQHHYVFHLRTPFEGMAGS